MPHLESQDPSSWGWSFGAAADIVDYQYREHAFPQGVARGTEPIWTAALDLICAQPGYQLPDPRPMVGGCWGFSPRLKVGGPGRSFHGYGLAIDVGAPWNPQGVVVPEPSVHRMPLRTGELVRPLGILWGADFRGTKDWMHLELHLAPSEVATLTAHLPRGPVSDEPSLLDYPLPSGCYYGPYSGPAESISGSGRSDAPYRPGLALAQHQLGVAADGYYGPNTAAAARSWQLGHGLAVDGLIGPATWRSLFAA